MVPVAAQLLGPLVPQLVVLVVLAMVMAVMAMIRVLEWVLLAPMPVLQAMVLLHPPLALHLVLVLSSRATALLEALLRHRHHLAPRLLRLLRVTSLLLRRLAMSHPHPHLRLRRVSVPTAAA
ncbi:hypothetical protein J3E74DRAFT_358470, partial [Bipolaris maydis]